MADGKLYVRDVTDTTWQEVGGAAAGGTFDGLSDTPADKVSSAHQFPKVDSGETDLEFALVVEESATPPIVTYPGKFWFATGAVPGDQVTSLRPGLSNYAGNSAFRIDQAGNAGGVTTSGAYVLDMWQMTVTLTAGLSTLSRSTTLRSAGLSRYSLQLNAAGNSYAGVNDTNFIIYKLEGNYIRELLQGFTISFWAMSDVTGRYAFSIRQGTPTLESYVVPLDLVASVWQYFSIDIPAPTQPSELDTGTGFFIAWSIGAGSASQTPTANTWHVGNFLSLTTANPLVTGNFYMAEPMISLSPSTFQPNLHSVDLNWAERYYEKSTETSGDPTGIGALGKFITSVGADSTKFFQYQLRYNQIKRIAPTITLYDLVGASGVITYPIAATGTNLNGQAGTAINTSDKGFIVHTDNTTSKSGMFFAWVADARL